MHQYFEQLSIVSYDYLYIARVTKILQELMNDFHLGNEKIDIILEVVMGLMEKDGKKSMHEAAKKCRIFSFHCVRTKGNN